MKTAAEIMDADVPSVTREEDARKAIDLLAQTDLAAIPVVDTEDKVVGIVSESDLMLSEEESDLHLPHYLNIMGGIVFVGSMKGFEERLNKAFATNVRDLMTPTRSSLRRRRRRDGGQTDRRRAPQPPARGRRRGRLAGWSPGPTCWPRSSTTERWQRAEARIDLGAVERNCAHLTATVGEGVELCAVVKADGYGHGAAACATAALAGGASWLAVATGARGGARSRRRFRRCRC